MAVALLASIVLAGCGLGPGEETGDASLLVTRDYGSEVLIDEPELPANESSTAMRLVDENADLETGYGGAYVPTVNDVSPVTPKAARSLDWFYFVNGIVAERGSAQFPVKGGDKVWWDYRDWTDAMDVGAVVGAYPAPFSTGYDNRDWGVEIDCLVPAATACGMVQKQLEGDGVKLESSGDNMILRVGIWDAIADTPEGRRIIRGPENSGVFARFNAPTTGTPEGAPGNTACSIGLDDHAADDALNYGPQVRTCRSDQAGDDAPGLGNDRGLRESRGTRRVPSDPEDCSHTTMRPWCSTVRITSPLPGVVADEEDLADRVRPRRETVQTASLAPVAVYLGAYLAGHRFSLVRSRVPGGGHPGAAIAGFGCLADRAVKFSLRLGATLAIAMAVINAIVTDRGATVLARLGDWPMLGRVDVTLEAIAAGGMIGLRVMGTMVVIGV